jgi:hypothetical protein
MSAVDKNKSGFAPALSRRESGGKPLFRTCSV